MRYASLPNDATAVQDTDLQNYRMRVDQLRARDGYMKSLGNIAPEPQETLFGGKQPINGAGLLFGSGMPARPIWMLPQKI